MSISPEVKAAVQQIRDDKNLISSMRAADALRDKQLADLQAQIDALKGQSTLSDDDKAALNAAVNDARDTHDELTSAVPANTDPIAPAGGQPVPVQTGPGSTADGAAPIDGPSAADGGVQVPLMPNSAFDPAGGSSVPVATDGQPNQPAAIETAGGFVIAGGGSTARAVGSMPDSPSSSLVVPPDPDAKAPASSADVAKSGLGDSSQNALLGNDGQPIADGPGIPKEPSDADVRAAQDKQDALAAEQEARRANPLNLAPAGTPQAGSQAAEGQRLPEGQTTDPNAPAPSTPPPASPAP